MKKFAMKEIRCKVDTLTDNLNALKRVHKSSSRDQAAPLLALPVLFTIGVATTLQVASTTAEKQRRISCRVLPY